MCVCANDKAILNPEPCQNSLQQSLKGICRCIFLWYQISQLFKDRTCWYSCRAVDLPGSKQTARPAFFKVGRRLALENAACPIGLDLCCKLWVAMRLD